MVRRAGRGGGGGSHSCDSWESGSSWAGSRERVGSSTSGVAMADMSGMLQHPVTNLVYRDFGTHHVLRSVTSCHMTSDNTQA